MSDERGKKRKKKQYYKQAKQAKPGYKLSAGMSGFLITCNSNEKMALREAYSLLNEYADKLYGPEQVGDDSSDSDEDLEAALKKEVQSLKEAKKAVRRFQHVKTGGHNLLFIKTTLKDPVELITTIMKDAYETKVAKSRHVMRFLPICATSKTVEEKILECAKQALAPYLSNPEGNTYSIIFKSRYNNSVTRTLIPKLGEVIKDLSTKNDVDLNTPDLAVIVNVIQGVCCLGVVRNFFKYSKYNLQAITTQLQEEEKEKLKSTDTSKDDPPVHSAEPCISGNDEEIELVEESSNLSDSRQNDMNIAVEFSSPPNNEAETDIEANLAGACKESTKPSSSQNVETASGQIEERTPPKKDQNSTLTDATNIESVPKQSEETDTGSEAVPRINWL